MTAPTFETLGQVLAGILSLSPEAFQALRQFPPDTVDALALGVVFVAGLSQAVAQSIILFINEVKPLRFGLSLVLAGLLFVAGYLFWALSIWLASGWLLEQPLAWQSVADALAFSYLPLVFSFLGAMPYLGVPLLRLLWVWNLLAVVVGFVVLANLSVAQAVGHVGLGWVLLQVLQQTVGQPIVNLGRWITNRTAGVKLVVDRAQLKTLITAHSLGIEPGVTPTPPTPEPAPADPLTFTATETALDPASPRRTGRRPQMVLYLGLGIFALVVALSLERPKPPGQLAGGVNLDWRDRPGGGRDAGPPRSPGLVGRLVRRSPGAPQPPAPGRTGPFTHPAPVYGLPRRHQPGHRRLPAHRRPLPQRTGATPAPGHCPGEGADSLLGLKPIAHPRPPPGFLLARR